MSHHREMDKQIVVYLGNEVLFSYEKEWNTAICYNTYDPWNSCGEKKPVTKATYCMISMKFLWNVQDR